MRRILAINLAAFLAALAGCGPEEFKPTSAPTFNPPTVEQLKQWETRFHDKEANQEVSDGQMPLQFIDSANRQVDLVSYQGRSNVVLVVVQGMPKSWHGQFCPPCLAQVRMLSANYGEFKKRDAEILMVFPGAKDKLPQFLHDGKVDGEDGNPKVPFLLLLDTDLKAVSALGITGDLARPSTYILDKKGNAVFAFVAAGVGGTADRPSVQSLLDRLDKLNGKK